LTAERKKAAMARVERRKAENRMATGGEKGAEKETVRPHLVEAREMWFHDATLTTGGLSSGTCSQVMEKASFGDGWSYGLFMYKGASVCWTEGIGALV
jgi:hypothetical protein